MSNPHPKTDHLRAYQIPEKRPGMNDHSTMLDMIKAGTDVHAFIEFWSKEAGYKSNSLITMYYKLKSKL